MILPWGTTFTKCYPYPAASKQLGVFASFRGSLLIVVFTTIPVIIFIFLWYEAQESDNIVIIDKPAKYKQAGSVHSIIQAF